MSKQAAASAGQESKRSRIDKANSTVFIVVAIASVVVVVSLTSIRFLWNQRQYNSRVITEKTIARDRLFSNLTNLEALTKQLPELDKNIISDQRAILHALPPQYDYAGLVSSINFLARESSVVLSGSIGEDQSMTAERSSSNPQPVEIPIAITVKGRPSNVKGFLEILERSTRTFKVTSLEVTGSNNELIASINASTYYQPVANLDIQTEEIR